MSALNGQALTAPADQAEAVRAVIRQRREEGRGPITILEELASLNATQFSPPLASDELMNHVTQALEAEACGERPAESHPDDDPPATQKITAGRLTPRTADIARVRPFRWAWHHRILIGYLNLLVGAEGVGKGTFLAWLIARLTRGDLPGDFRGQPARVLIVGDEDGFDNVWVPRLLAAGADLSMVLDLPPGDDGALDLGRDCDDLHGLIAEHAVDAVIFDQLLDNLGVTVDDWRAKPVREAIAPLRRIAADLDVVLLAALHTNKGRTGSFRERVSGTQAFNALSRSSLLLADHPEDPERRALVRGKGNYSRTPPSIEFAIGSVTVEVNGFRIPVGAVLDVAEGELTADDVLGQPAKALTKADQGRRLIADELADGEWHKASELLALLEEAGIRGREAGRLSTDLGVEKKKAPGFPTHALWRLARGDTPVYPSSPSSLSEDDRPARPASAVDRQGPDLATSDPLLVAATRDELDLADEMLARHPDLAQ